MASLPKRTRGVARDYSKIKGAMKKESGTSSELPTVKKSVSFIEGLEEHEPPYPLFEPPSLSKFLTNDLEQQNFREVWREISQKKFVYAARVLQQFARKHMLCWILVNDRRTELIEELDDIDRFLEGDLERVEWMREDMMEEARLEIQAEIESGQLTSSQNVEVKDNIEIIRNLQEEMRSVKQDNAKIKHDCKEVKKENKQLGYDLKEKAAPVAMCQYKVDALEENHQMIQQNHDQYAPGIKKWEDSIQEVQKRLEFEQRDGKRYKDTIVKIVGEMKERTTKRRLLEEIFEILRHDFYPNMASSPPVTPRKKKSIKKRSSVTPKEKKKATTSRRRKTTTDVPRLPAVEDEDDDEEDNNDLNEIDDADEFAVDDRSGRTLEELTRLEDNSSRMWDDSTRMENSDRRAGDDEDVPESNRIDGLLNDSSHRSDGRKNGKKQKEKKSQKTSFDESDLASHIIFEGSESNYDDIPSLHDMNGIMDSSANHESVKKEKRAKKHKEEKRASLESGGAFQALMDASYHASESAGGDMSEFDHNYVQEDMNGSSHHSGSRKKKGDRPKEERRASLDHGGAFQELMDVSYHSSCKDSDSNHGNMDGSSHDKLDGSKKSHKKERKSHKKHKRRDEELSDGKDLSENAAEMEGTSEGYGDPVNIIPA